MKHHKESQMFLLETVSPVHVGCDDVYEPTGFLVDETEGCLIVFDTLDFISNLDPEDRSRFSDICRTGTIESIVELYRFLRNRQAPGRRVQLVPGFIRHYQSVLQLAPARIKMELSRFEIQRTACCLSDQRPYIPGSAVKGAVRTAVLNALARQRKLPHPRGKRAHRELEEKLLNLAGVPAGDRMAKDPFRLIKVSDFMPVGDIEARVVYAVNRKKTAAGDDARGPYQIVETVLPGSLFAGRITVEKPQLSGAVSMVFSLEQIMECCSLFYGGEKDREAEEFATMGMTHITVAGNGGKLLRVGRHSGAECVTIEGHRDIRIMQNRGARVLDHATTVWVTSESRQAGEVKTLFPLGWTMLKPIDTSGQRKIAAVEEDYQRRLSQTRDSRRQAVQERMAEERKRRELAEKQREEDAREKAAEAERQARIAAMSPEERMVEEVRDPSVTENRVVEIYSRIDDFSEELKPQLARALKDYWMAAGKWKKKKCTAKQWKKVQQVKSILGE
jgi:CRISPR-associated protein Csm5